MNTETFVAKAKEVHGDRFDYSKVNYINSKSKVTIICPKHGEWETAAYSHLQGKKCRACGYADRKERTLSNDAFINACKKVHNNKYDYSKVKYSKAHNNVTIICPEHGEFLQKAYIHKAGHGCPSCALLESKKKHTKDEWIAKARKVHGDKYDYSKVNYINSKSKVTIICPDHGEFEQVAGTHLVSGCNACGYIKASKSHRKELDLEFVKYNKIHGDKYEYIEKLYDGYTAFVRYICPLHGEVIQRTSDHVRGIGCRRCSLIESKAEKELADYIESLGYEVIRGDRNIIKPLELDIVIPEKKIAIEYNGLLFHSTHPKYGKQDMKYHKNKTSAAAAAGYRLIHIFEDMDKDKVKMFLANILSNEKPIYARNCTLSEIDGKTANKFLNKHHFLGGVSASKYIGTYYNDVLVGVTTFRKGAENTKNKEWYELNRHATSMKIIGILGKVSKFSGYNKIYSFSDNCLYVGRSYEKAGFKKVSEIAPDYMYVINNKRVHKFNFRKSILLKEYEIDPALTELEMTKQLGIYKVYDCGKTRWEFTASRH